MTRTRDTIFTNSRIRRRAVPTMLRHLRRQTIMILSSVLALGLLAQFSSAGGHRRCAHTSNGIPNYGYQTNEVRQRATVASHVVPNTEPAGQSKKKLFQPFEESLVVGDCSLTQLRLTVESDGTYRLGYRATNSAPSLDLAPLPTAEKTKAETKKTAETKKVETKKASDAKPIMPVRHHRFQITVRLFSGPENPNQPDHKRAGGIALAQLTLDPFHVAAASELVDSKANCSAEFQRQFSAATQAEFELEIDPSVTLPTKTARP